MLWLGEIHTYRGGSARTRDLIALADWGMARSNSGNERAHPFYPLVRVRLEGDKGMNAVVACSVVALSRRRGFPEVRRLAWSRCTGRMRVTQSCID